MSKWQKISPDQIKAGDLVKVRHAMGDYEETTSAVANYVTDQEIGVGPYNLYKDQGTWYIAKPKKAKPFPPAGFAPDATNASDDTEPWHNADMWCDEYIKEVSRNRQLVADTTDLRVKIQETEARLKITYDNLQDAYATIDDQAAEIEKWKTKAVALAKQMRADKRDAEPTRPDEPPVGSFFRVDRTGIQYVRIQKYNLKEYFVVSELGNYTWEFITEPGDTLTMLFLTEATDD